MLFCRFWIYFSYLTFINNYMRYGLFSYSTSNIGDEVQSIAAKQFLPPEILTYFDRDNIDNTDISEKTKLIMNGWFTHKPENWPPKNTLLDPLLISFHIANEWWSSAKKLLTKESLDFYTKHGPIGCRDLDTETLLREKGIDAYFSGCLTLTLKNKFKKRNNTIYIVDVDEKVIKFIPKSIRKNAKLITHIVWSWRRYDSSYKFSLAQKRLDEYAQAKLVITSRIHCALPCLAFGTPVIFIHQNLADPRFSGLLEYLHHYSVSNILTGNTIVDWENIQHNPRDISILREKLKDTCIWFIGKNYYDNKRVFEEGVSIINASKNRTENLKKSLKTWLTHKEVSEIILVDWSCDIPLEIALKEFLHDKRITIIRAENQNRWLLSKSFNLAADFVTKDKILKLDADILLKEDFFQKHVLENGNFYRGNWKNARDHNEQHLMGVGFFYTDDILKIGGYNELLTTWGYDDNDLYNRLKENNISEIEIDNDSLYHTPHGDDMRFKYQKSSRNKSLEIGKNALLTQRYTWNKKKKRNFWKIMQINTNSYVVTEKKYDRIMNHIRDTLLRNIILFIHIPFILIKNPKITLKIVQILWKR